jgi:HEAT repeat protein
VEALGDIGNPHTVPVLIGALRDDNPNVRRKAEQALEKIGTPEALAAIGKGNSAP